MGSAIPLLLALVVLVAVGALIVVAVASLQGGAARRRELFAAQQRATEAARFIDRLREIAWDHRDVDPALSTIFIDEIRQFERKQKEIDG